MKIHRTFALTAVIAVLVGLPLAADWPVTEKLDLDAVFRIKEEGLQRSKVMEIESYLTDVYGPRHTNSPEIKEAAEYAQKAMREWNVAEFYVQSKHYGAARIYYENIAKTYPDTPVAKEALAKIGEVTSVPSVGFFKVPPTVILPTPALARR